MSDKITPAPSPTADTPEQLIHDIATPLLTSKLNAELLQQYIVTLISDLENDTQGKQRLPQEQKVIDALKQAPSIIEKNIGIAQQKIKHLSKILFDIGTHEEASQQLLDLHQTERAEKPSNNIQSVLLVEDEKIHQDIGLQLLEEKYSVELADNGLDALKKCEQKSYDLILMDLRMPKMSGEVATSTLRGLIGYDTLIVGLTNTPIGNKRTELLALGFNGFLDKPLKLTDFDSLLHQMASRVE